MSNEKIIGAANPRHEAQLQKLLEFCGADSIRYEDLGKGENYVLEKNGKVLVLRIRGNHFDGGFLTVSDGTEQFPVL